MTRPLRRPEARTRREGMALKPAVHLRPDGIGAARAAAQQFHHRNLVDSVQVYGHRNDIPGFHGALRQFDAALPRLLTALREDDLLFVTADHGNDPLTPSTEHAPECARLSASVRSHLQTTAR